MPSKYDKPVKCNEKKEKNLEEMAHKGKSKSKDKHKQNHKTEFYDRNTENI